MGSSSCFCAVKGVSTASRTRGMQLKGVRNELMVQGTRMTVMSRPSPKIGICRGQGLGSSADGMSVDEGSSINQGGQLCYSTCIIFSHTHRPLPICQIICAIHLPKCSETRQILSERFVTALIDSRVRAKLTE